MPLQARSTAYARRFRRLPATLGRMNTRTNRSHRQPRQAPLDQLRPGARQARPPHDQPTQVDEPIPPDVLDTDAARGKNTRSTAEVGLRRHLEGSEQGPM